MITSKHTKLGQDLAHLKSLILSWEKLPLVVVIKFMTTSDGSKKCEVMSERRIPML